MPRSCSLKEDSYESKNGSVPVKNCLVCRKGTVYWLALVLSVKALSADVCVDCLS